MVSAVLFAHALAEQLGFAALVVLLHSETTRHYPQGGKLREPLLAVIFALGVVLTMAAPLDVMPGVRVDARHVLIGLASFLIGPIGAATTVAAAVWMRLGSGGLGLAAGVTGTILTAAVSLAWRARLSQRGAALRVRDVVALGFLINASVLSVFVLPPGLAFEVLRTGGLVVIAANVLGCLMVGTLLVREDRRIRAEAHERVASRTDPLTGLANRRGFEEALRAKAAGPPVTAMILIDVDEFKSINDVFGHAQGDRVLQEVAGIVRAQVRTNDMAARLGGDEFVALIRDAPPEMAREIGERICGLVRRRFRRRGDPCVSVSVGVALVEEQGVAADMLLEAADAAMYLAKAAGRGRMLVDGPVPRAAASVSAARRTSRPTPSDVRPDEASARRGSDPRADRTPPLLAARVA